MGARQMVWWNILEVIGDILPQQRRKRFPVLEISFQLDGMSYKAEVSPPQKSLETIGMSLSLHWGRIGLDDSEDFI